MNPQPNILLIICDQLTPAALPAYGNPVVHAPVISRLASEGVVFDSAYCSAPLCAPARYGLLSGCLPSRLGGYDNASELPTEAPTFAHYLRLAGYRTILSGKMHFVGPNQLHGFEERLTTDIYPADFGWVPNWDRPGERQEWYHNMSSVLEAGPCIRTNQLDYDEEVVHATRRKLYDLARRPDGRPFLLTVSLTHPHDPYVIPQRYWDLYRQDEIPLPQVSLDSAPLDPHSARLHAACLSGTTALSDDQVRCARRAYYGAVSYADEQIGRLLQTLAETGAMDRTIVVLASDHGDMLGERGLWYKMHFFEGAVRVPLIVRAPGRFAPARVRSSVALHDLLPTLVELAGGQEALQSVCNIDGRSLVPHLAASGGHDEAWAEYMAEGAQAPMAMLRRGPYKFIHSPGDPDLLFDLQADPLELRNLADEPGHRHVVQAFSHQLRGRWNFQALHEQVLCSQRRRRLVHQAEQLGRRAAWDFQPSTDASTQYVRSHMPLDDIEAMARFPSIH